ncbi:MAG: SDR family oxidoreductase [Deltaproteobacteria bacterium]|nr:SDR family oxidoreductase [Deltaproteobacteria bacterium]
MGNLSVVITGTSSGIGEACALYLSRKGFHVFAGVRNGHDGDALLQESSENITPLLLDVTDHESIATSLKKVSDATNKNLFALINNAGIAFGGPLEMVSLFDIQHLIEVNVTGVFAVTKAFIPLLRNNGGGRIVNMGSMAGFFAFPGLSVYSASKYALRAINDSLRLELSPSNISLSIVELGKIKTPMWDKAVHSADETLCEAQDDMMTRYSSLINRLRQYIQNPNALMPDKVAQTVFHILTSKKPKNRYLLGKDSLLFNLMRNLPFAIREKLLLWNPLK